MFSPTACWNEVPFFIEKYYKPQDKPKLLIKKVTLNGMLFVPFFPHLSSFFLSFFSFLQSMKRAARESIFLLLLYRALPPTLLFKRIVTWNLSLLFQPPLWRLFPPTSYLLQTTPTHSFFALLFLLFADTFGFHFWQSEGVVYKYISYVYSSNGSKCVCTSVCA